MKKLIDLWEDSKRCNKQKFRFIDWNHQTRFLRINRLSDDETSFIVTLDNGEKMSIPVDSDFWDQYREEDEESSGRLKTR